MNLNQVLDDTVDEMVFEDSWQAKYYNPQTLFDTVAFKEVFLSKPKKTSKKQTSKKQIKPQAKGGEYVQHFSLLHKGLKPHQNLCILGSSKELGKWKRTNRIELSEESFGVWTLSLVIPKSKRGKTKVHYKYGIYNKRTKSFSLEEGHDRVLTGCLNVSKKQVRYVQDSNVNIPSERWKASGVALPVFSSRSKNGLGVGEFLDFKLWVDWAKKVGMKIIQILPVNDTTKNYNWLDSYPYSAISVYALNPIYINIEAVGISKIKYCKMLHVRSKKSLTHLKR